MTSSATPVGAASQAAQFNAEHRDYFFADAHHLVEASASTSAKEIAPNVFEFSDASILHISTQPPVVGVYGNRAEFLAARDARRAPAGAKAPVSA